MLPVAPAVMEPGTFHLRWCWKLLWGRERFPIGQPLLVMGHCSSWGQSPNSHVRSLAWHLIFHRWIKESKRAQLIMVQLCHAQTKSYFNGNFFSADSCFVVNRCQTWCLLSLGLAMRPLMCQTTTRYLFKQWILLSLTERERVSSNTNGCLF